MSNGSLDAAPTTTGLISVIASNYPLTAGTSAPCRSCLCYASWTNHRKPIYVPIYGPSDHYPLCFVHRSRGPKSPKSHHDTIKYGAPRILTRIVLFTIYTLLHGRCLTCLKMQMTSWTRVRTHDKNSGETVRRLGTIIQSIFVPNQEPAFAWPLEMVRWESVPKVSSARAWKLSSGLFSWPDWLPLGVRGCASRWFTSNQMVPNAKKTKPLLIATRQKLQHVNQPTLDLFLNGNRL